MPNRDYLTAQGNPVTEADVALALANWAQIATGNGAAVNSPHTQTGPAATCVAALCMMPQSSGIFLVAAKASFSDGTTGGALVHQLFTKQGANTGQIAGGTAAAKLGAGAPGLGAGLATFIGTNGQILNVDAAGGGGLTFEGGVAGSQIQSSDHQATLTGLLTGQGIGIQNFQFFGVIDAVGPTSLTKTPFTLNVPMNIALVVTDTAAHVVTYDALSLFAIELPVR